MALTERIRKLEQCLGELDEDPEVEVHIRETATFYGLPVARVREIYQEVYYGPNPGGMAEYLNFLEDEERLQEANEPSTSPPVNPPKDD
jgi:hypothetical protein